MTEAAPADRINALLAQTDAVRAALGGDFHDRIVEATFTDAAAIADHAVTRDGETQRFDLTRAIDRWVTHPRWGFVFMALLFTVVFWLTIAGANVPSALLGEFFNHTLYGWLHTAAAWIGTPKWLSGLLIDGVYLSTGWVISVMLPPMAIFFPLFTLLEDFGYLPRVAFNMDALFHRAGAHGKQALTMMMGYGCNAAGVVATRIIDSPRERLIAILTNNFSICNGRWPTLILMGTIFIGAFAPAWASSLIASLSVVTTALIGIVMTLLISRVLSRTLLKGEASAFSLELPPYRPPQIWQTLYRSIIDRTVLVLWRAITMAAPAGAIIWLVSNITLDGGTLAWHLVNFLNPVGLFFGLNGVILLAYVIAIPANEIVIPSILMLTLNFARSSLAQQGVMLQLEDAQVYQVLTQLGGWTLSTAVCLMLFSLLHNPCGTTIVTIYKETKSLKWTAVAVLMPLAIGFTVTGSVANIWRLLERF
ncbi:MAG: ferrous iron transporter B [Chloroflexi bacterium]|nr:ferrous iron transporter B [Chloroflexota bacterium]